MQYWFCLGVIGADLLWNNNEYQANIMAQYQQDLMYKTLEGTDQKQKQTDKFPLQGGVIGKSLSLGLWQSNNQYLQIKDSYNSCIQHVANIMLL